MNVAHENTNTSICSFDLGLIEKGSDMLLEDISGSICLKEVQKSFIQAQVLFHIVFFLYFSFFFLKEICRGVCCGTFWTLGNVYIR